MTRRPSASRSRSAFAPTILVCLLSAFGCGRCDDAARPASVFDDEAVITGLEAPTSMDFTSTGGLFVAEKAGRIRYFRSVNDRAPTLVADLSEAVMEFYDRGLLAIAVHPAFPTEPYVYVLYTYDAPIGGVAPVYNDLDNREVNGTASGRLSRLELTPTEDGGYVLATEHVLVHDWCQDFSVHSVASLAFGPDGYLYAGAGDSGAFVRTADTGQHGNLCGDPPDEGGSVRAQDILSPSDPTGLDGAVIRVDPITGEGAADNPFAASMDPNARRIIAWGMRNPNKLTFRPNTSELWLTDVGHLGWEEVNRISTPYLGTNLGWPCYEGAEAQSAFAGKAFCERFADALVDGTATHAPPYFSYPNNERRTETAPCGGDAASITGIAFNVGTRYPGTYEGGLFLADYARNCIWALARGEDGLPDTSRQLLVTQSARTPLDLQAGPDGFLYYIAIWEGGVRRLTYGLMHDAGMAEPPDPRAPIPTITTPAAESSATRDEQISIAGQATDADGNALPSTALSWRIQVVHCDDVNADACHFHTLVELPGVSEGTFRMPGDHTVPSYVDVRLQAETIEAGVRHVGTSSRRIYYVED